MSTYWTISTSNYQDVGNRKEQKWLIAPWEWNQQNPDCGKLQRTDDPVSTTATTKKKFKRPVDYKISIYSNARILIQTNYEEKQTRKTRCGNFSNDCTLANIKELLHFFSGFFVYLYLYVARKKMVFWKKEFQFCHYWLYACYLDELFFSWEIWHIFQSFLWRSNMIKDKDDLYECHYCNNKQVTES